MKRLSFTKPVLATVIGLGALVAASAAQARSDVYFSIGVQAPYEYVQPAPVYVQPAPVYVQPQPVYVQPQPVYVQPQPVYGQRYDSYGWQRHRGPWGDSDRDGVPNIRDRDSRYYDGHRGHRGGRDADRDGVPNRFDRAPHNPYYR
jgi:hypothetical protein